MLFDNTEDDEPPPFLREWRRIYAGVAIYFLCIVALLSVISQCFTY